MAKLKKKSKGLSQKQIGVIAAAFGVVLVGGVVFAATTGLLEIGGTVGRGANVDLDFVDATCSIQTTSGVAPGEGFQTSGASGGDYNCGLAISDILARTNGENDRLDWGVFLRSPGDSVTINFSITNVGSVDAYLAAISIADQTGFGVADGQVALSGTALTMGGTTIPVGGSTGPYTITVTWPAGSAAAYAGATFMATLSYSQAP